MPNEVFFWTLPSSSRWRYSRSLSWEGVILLLLAQGGGGRMLFNSLWRRWRWRIIVIWNSRFKSQINLGALNWSQRWWTMTSSTRPTFATLYFLIDECAVQPSKIVILALQIWMPKLLQILKINWSCDTQMLTLKEATWRGGNFLKGNAPRIFQSS